MFARGMQGIPYFCGADHQERFCLGLLAGSACLAFLYSESSGQKRVTGAQS